MKLEHAPIQPPSSSNHSFPGLSGTTLLTQPCLVSRPIPGVVPNHLQVLHTTGLSQLFEEVGVLETLRQDVQDLKLVLPSNGRDRVSVNHPAGPRGVRGGETSRCFFFVCFFRCYSGSWSEKPGGMAPPTPCVFTGPHPYPGGHHGHLGRRRCVSADGMVGTDSARSALASAC